MALNVCPQGQDSSRAEVVRLRVRAQEEVIDHPSEPPRVIAPSGAFSFEMA